ncbi:MAG: AEC family transporter [Verrucomicrobiota bacterium]
MATYTTILNASIPAFLIIGLGMLLRKLGVIKEESNQCFLSLLINCLIPCLTLDALVGNERLENVEILILTPLVGFLSVALGLGVGIVLAKAGKLKEPAQINAFAYCIGVYNWGYIPIPLTLELFGQDTMGVLFLFNMGVQLAMWSIALVLLTNHQKGIRSNSSHMRSLLILLLNPPILAIFIGLMLNATNAEAWLPKAVQSFLSITGASSIPIGLLLVGGSFIDVFRKSSLLRPIKVGVLSLLGKLVIIPAILLLLLVLVPLPLELQRVLVVQAGMPSAVMAIIYAKHYRADEQATVQCVAYTSLCSLITIPLFIQFACQLLNISILPANG